MAITAEQLISAIRRADEEKHEYRRLNWLDADDLSEVIIDGRLDLMRVAEILSESEPKQEHCDAP